MIIEKRDCLIFGEYKLFSKYIEPVYGFPFEPEETKKLWHNRFNINIKNDKTKKRVTFPFYSSYVDYEKGKKKIEPFELYEPLQMIFSEFQENMSFHDFCDNYGYDYDSRNAEKTYKKCKKQFEKLFNFLGEKDYNVLYSFIQEAVENYNNN